MDKYINGLVFYDIEEDDDFDNSHGIDVICWEEPDENSEEDEEIHVDLEVKVI